MFYFQLKCITPCMHTLWSCGTPPHPPTPHTHTSNWSMRLFLPDIKPGWWYDYDWVMSHFDKQVTYFLHMMLLTPCPPPSSTPPTHTHFQLKHEVFLPDMWYETRMTHDSVTNDTLWLTGGVHTWFDVADPWTLATVADPPPPPPYPPATHSHTHTHTHTLPTRWSCKQWKTHLD